MTNADEVEEVKVEEKIVEQVEEVKEIRIEAK